MPMISLLGLWLYASADTIDGFTSESEITVISVNDNSSFSMPEFCTSASCYVCASSSDIPFGIYDDENNWVYFSSNNSCSYYEDIDMETAFIVYNGRCYVEEGACDEGSEAIDISWKFYFSENTITYSSSSDSSDDSSVDFPSIPSSFTSWITTLVNNFGWTMVARLPTIILVSMWIVAIFALFRVVRRYAKKSFRW